MDIRKFQWFFSGCTVAVVCYVALLPTTMAGEVKVSEEREEYCANLGDFFTRCPVERFPLLGQTQKRDVLWKDEYLKEFLQAASVLGVDKTCAEFTDYHACVRNTLAAAEQECADDMGLEYVYNLDLVDFIFNPALEPGFRLCEEYFADLSEHFQCVTNTELFARIRTCSNGRDKEAAKQCIKDEIANTENCKPGALPVFKAFVDVSVKVQQERVQQLEAMEAQLKKSEA